MGCKFYNGSVFSKEDFSHFLDETKNDKIMVLTGHFLLRKSFSFQTILVQL